MGLVASAKSLVKRSIVGAARPFGVELHLTKIDEKHDFVMFDRNQLSSYFQKNAVRQLYDLALRKSDVEWSDNFSKQSRYYSLAQGVRFASKLNGDAVECGCWKGHSTYIIAKLLADDAFAGRFHVFDSFEGGLSDFKEPDRDLRYELGPAEIERRKQSFASTEHEVARVVVEFPFVTLYRGWIPERFAEVEDRNFRFVHVDVDLYQPTFDTVQFFYPRMVDGGVMVLDDYGLSQFPGAQTAVDDYLGDKSPQLFYEVPTGGALLIK